MKNKITQEEINELIEKSSIEIFKSKNKCTIVVVELENGFILTESSACVDPKNFDEQIGYDICINRIKNKLWEMKGFQLQDEIFQTGGKLK